MRQEGEPSVDQILRSIKKVMARDAERASATRAEGAGDAAAPVPTHPAPHSQADDAAAAVARFPAEPAPEPAYEEEAEDLRGASAPAAFPEERRLAEAELIEPSTPSDDRMKDEADDEAEIGADTTPAGSVPQGEALTSAATAAATRRSLAALAMLADPDAPLPTGPAGDAALQAIVRDMLQPMLSRWLEANLPALVEREVRAEIARITGGLDSRSPEGDA
jgi:cell pole-organizing protein PopZ